MPDGSLAVGVTENVRVEVPFGSLAAVLVLVECYQANDRHDEAIGLLQQLGELQADPALAERGDAGEPVAGLARGRHGPKRRATG